MNDREARKLLVAPEYHERQVESARKGVENAQARLGEARDRVAQRERELSDAQQALSDEQALHAEAVNEAKRLDPDLYPTSDESSTVTPDPAAADGGALS